MSRLDHIRGLLRDRLVKPGALGTTSIRACLDVSLVEAWQEAKDALSDAEQERDRLIASAPDDDRRGGALRPAIDTSEVDARIAELGAAVEAADTARREATIKVTAKSLGSTEYDALVRSYSDPDDSDRQALLDALWEQGLIEVTCEGEKLPLVWAEIAPTLGPGERENANIKIIALNKRVVEVPLS